MKIKPGDIFRAKRAKLGKAEYSRPFVVLRLTALDADICFLSTKFDLMTAGDLTLSELDTEFNDTGLDESSYLVADSGHPVQLSFFNNAKFLGCLTGDFKTRVEEWWGEKF